jgi:hypothetical protein
MRIATLIACTAAMVGAMSDRASAEPVGSNVIKIAVFGFELQDVSPAGALGKGTTSDTSLQKATTAAREELQAPAVTALSASTAWMLNRLRGGRCAIAMAVRRKSRAS